MTKSTNPGDETGATPGPWHASRRFIYINDLHNNVVAEVMPSPNRETIAKLLAAAPELAAALEQTLCELTACNRQLAARGYAGSPDNSVARAQKRARAALASIKDSPQ